jgi:hypothetical protein
MLRIVLSRPIEDGFAKVAILEQEVCSITKEKIVVDVEWTGHTDRGVPRQLSARTTINYNKIGGGGRMHLPLREMDSEDEVRHDVYVVERLELAEKDGVVIASNEPKDPGLVVPVVCTILFNNDEFVSSLGHFGIGDGHRYKPPYFDVIREAIVKVTTGYYDGIGISFAIMQRPEKSIGIEVEIKEYTGKFPGNTRFIETRYELGFGLEHNIFAWCEKSTGVMNSDPRHVFWSAVGPSSMLFKNISLKSDNSKVLHEVFGPLGVPRDSVMNPPKQKPKIPKPRTVTEGRVEGQVTDLDVANTSVSMSATGVIKVTTTNPSVVPKQRATDIQRALNALANSVGTIAAHELGHCLGLVADPGPEQARIDIPETGTQVSSPLFGGHESHNWYSPGNDHSRLMDDPSTIRLRLIFKPGRRLPFFNLNWQYLRDCFPKQP